MTYYTHAGLFHCDEVAGFAICRLAGFCKDVVRLNDITNIPRGGIVADIGRQHAPLNYIFDHHQELLTRENGYPLASAGLLWDSFGAGAVKTLMQDAWPEGVWDERAIAIKKRVDETLIQGIDAHDADNAYTVAATCCAGPVRILTLPNIISSFNSEDIKNEFDQVVQFHKAADFFAAILKKEIIDANQFIEDCERFDAIAEVEGDVITLKEPCRWKEIVSERYPNALYVVSPSAHPGSPYSITRHSRHPRQPRSEKAD